MSESQELEGSPINLPVVQARSQDTSTFPENLLVTVNPTRNEDAVKRLVLIYK
jgi:hypothetical protein